MYIRVETLGHAKPCLSEKLPIAPLILHSYQQCVMAVASLYPHSLLFCLPLAAILLGMQRNLTVVLMHICLMANFIKYLSIWVLKFLLCLF